MMQSNLQQTVFHIEKLRNVVGVGNCAAYQICPTFGPEIGHMGRVPGGQTQTAANQDLFNDEPSKRERGVTNKRWLLRLITSINF
jgi:hypothetical protein